MAVSRDREEIAAVKSFVTHQAFDEGDRLTIWRPARNGNLKRGFVNGCRVAFGDVDRVNLRDPPIVIARSRRSRCNERLVVGRPIVIVDVKIFWRNLAQLPADNIENSDPLIMNSSVDHAGRRWRGH